MWKSLLVQEPIAFLVGLAAVWWIDPTSTGGNVLAFAIGFAVWNALWLVTSGVLGFFGGTSNRKGNKGKNKKPPEDEED